MKKRADYRREGSAYLQEQGRLARSAREALDLSLGELAKQTGIPKATLHGYEAGSMDSELVGRMYRDLAKCAAMAAGHDESAVEAGKVEKAAAEAADAPTPKARKRLAGIPVDSRAKVHAALDDIQRGARVRLATVHDIDICIQQVERELDIPRTRLDGTVVMCDPHAQDFPNSYRGIPMSTSFRLENRRGKWYYTGAYRDRCHTAADCRAIILSDTARSALLGRISRGFDRYTNDWR